MVGGNSTDLQPKQMLEVTPKNALTFNGQLDDFGQVKSVSLVIKNCELSDIYFKVKSTASRFYSVRPNTGVISPYGRVKVTVQLNDDCLSKLDEIEANKHKFLIMSAVVSNPSVPADEFWKGKKEESENVCAMKIKAKVDRSRRQSAETIDDASSENNKTIQREKTASPEQQNKHSNSPANHFFAQYCAEMVETLLEKIPERDAFQLRKELNDVLEKYEAGIIGG